MFKNNSSLKASGLTKVSVYETNIDYMKLGIENKNEINELVLNEQIIISSNKKIGEEIMKLSKALYDSQEIFTKSENRNFLLWINSLNLSKTTVYRFIDRYKLYLKYSTVDLFELSERAVANIKKIEKSSSEKDVIEIFTLPLSEQQDKIFNILENINKNEIEVIDFKEDPKIVEKKRVIYRLNEIEIEIINLEKEKNRLQKLLKNF
ncbi:hypothetical protein [uncultured Cetobacterium sp.]|nr:hypothetical protein [uncultured Cetobacterium sp.]